MLKIEIAKRSDGAGLLRCTRADGSVTWQKQSERHAVHFTMHDLTHYAVETTLGYQRGFFGLIAEGWDMDDTTGKGSRGRLPAEAGEVECVVGLFDAERGSGTLWTAEDFATYSPAPITRELNDETIQRVRARRAELFRQWSAVPVGGTLTLEL